MLFRAAVANIWLLPLVLFPTCWAGTPPPTLSVTLGFRSHDIEAIVAMHRAAASLRLIDDLTAHGFRATSKTGW
jgi:hypothetical protein